MRLIDADKLKSHKPFTIRGGQIGEYYEGYSDCAVEADEAVQNAPTVDATPIVRCKDCIWRGREECAMFYRCNCGEQHTWETDDDFCSYGERIEK